MLGLVAWWVPAEALAAPVIEAAIVWQGDCDDRPLLVEEIRARGATLEERPPGSAPLELVVTVTRESDLAAELELVAPEGRERRSVQARNCEELRSVIAWVLVVLAEERSAAHPSASKPAEAPAKEALPSSAESPGPADEPSSHAALESVPAATAPPARQAERQGPPSCRGAGGLSIGPEAVVAGEWVPAVTLGGAVFARYAPCERWLPGVELAASQLFTLSYERDGREISVNRLGGRAVLWLELGTPAFDGGLGVELSRLRATASSSPAGSGGSDSALFWAIALPLRFTLPLAHRVGLRVGVDALYAPSEYSFVYRSGETLTRGSHFELRGVLGLAARF